MKKILYIFLLIFSSNSFAQHYSKLDVVVDNDKKVLTINQELTFFNQSNDTVSSIVLNDWNNAFSDKRSPLGNRFSDEFVRSFFLASDFERGNTSIQEIMDQNQANLNWSRPKDHIDLVEVTLNNKVLPHQKTTIKLSYTIKIPDDKFTNYGYNNKGNITLKNWFLTPARYDNHHFVEYSNLNLDDATVGLFDADLKITIPNDYFISSNLIESKREYSTFYLTGSKLFDISINIEKRTSFAIYKNTITEVVSNLEDNRLDNIGKAIIIDKVVNYVADNIGAIGPKRIIVSQSDYDKNQFYGLSQLPSFITPFPDDFIYEMKFLKTYLNNYLKSSLQLDQRKDNWVYDAIQMYYLMKYIDVHYPDAKMMGSLAKYRLIRGYQMFSANFNEQYTHFYMLMARKNMDQPIGDSKNTLLKFNEKIASKYRAGLSFRYLAEYMGKTELETSINQFLKIAKEQSATDAEFENIIKSNSAKDVSWFFDILINSRKIIDYKFDKVTKTEDSVSFNIKNKTNVNIPMPVYGLKNNEIVFKEWINTIKKDSIYTFKRNNADKIVLNYKSEVPEFNQRNNWKSLKPFCISNKPFKFNFMKDLENPFYNQILYVPTIDYNLYDGIIPGMRIHNRTLLDKPFIFDITPSYSLRSQTLSGTFNLALLQYNRDKKLYSVRYGLNGEYYHYAPDATYQKLNPFISLRLRENDYRNNHRQNIMFRQVYVNREKSNYVKNNFEGSYMIFDARYSNTLTEITKHFGYGTDLQLSKNFGKASAEMSFRRLFKDNRQVNLRIFGGLFLYNNSDSPYFNFALDRPTDYMFDYNYLGRSESTGLFSQQYITAEGGFKSKLRNPYSNQWITTANASFNIWNWIEVYGDVGLLKNKGSKEQFVYDSGIRFNLVTDYFELYLPVCSNNGWEVSQPKYAEKIRFIVAFSPNTLINLFTRKWF